MTDGYDYRYNSGRPHEFCFKTEGEFSRTRYRVWKSDGPGWSMQRLEYGAPPGKTVFFSDDGHLVKFMVDERIIDCFGFTSKHRLAERFRREIQDGQFHWNINFFGHLMVVDHPDDNRDWFCEIRPWFLTGDDHIMYTDANALRLVIHPFVDLTFPIEQRVWRGEVSADLTLALLETSISRNVASIVTKFLWTSAISLDMFQRCARNAFDSYPNGGIALCKDVRKWYHGQSTNYYEYLSKPEVSASGTCEITIRER